MVKNSKFARFYDIEQSHISQMQQPCLEQWFKSNGISSSYFNWLDSFIKKIKIYQVTNGVKRVKRVCAVDRVLRVSTQFTSETRWLAVWRGSMWSSEVEVESQAGLLSCLCAAFVMLPSSLPLWKPSFSSR